MVFEYKRDKKQSNFRERVKLHAAGPFFFKITATIHLKGQYGPAHRSAGDTCRVH
jgi:hypothetical protein